MKTEPQSDLQPQESLAIINSMIQTAKNKLADDGFYIIFWGWLVFAASLIHYTGIQTGFYQAGVVWPILMPAGGLVSYLYGRKANKKETVKTYIHSYLQYSWLAFGVALAITLVFFNVHGLKSTYFFLMLLYGMATFISGGILNFRPLVIGGLCSFACAIASVFLSDQQQLLCIAIALLCSYIIPGHLLRKEYKSQTHV